MNNSYAYITAAAPTTTVIATIPCVLAGIAVNTAAADGVITIYDGASVATGTVIAIITAPAVLIQNHYSLDCHDICLKEGLTIVTSVGAQDITVAYRPSA